MNPQNQFKRNKLINFLGLAAILLIVLGMPTINRATQGTPEPLREQLLNGLNILILHRPGDQEVLLKLRIRSGAAYDLANKEGTMALLSDTLFPDPTTRQYVTEELGGRLNVTIDYDAINVTLTGRATVFERLVELLRNALLTPQLGPEMVGRLREERLKAVRDISQTPAAIADRAIATRLYGSYPYGRSIAGTPETLARIDRSDILYARERFLNPNNSTLVVIGGVDYTRARRALRQLLGSWRKSEKIVPATFRQPGPPDARTLVINLPGAQQAEIRLAIRGLSRSDKDRAAAMLLASLAQERWLAAFPELRKGSFSVRHDAHALSGIFLMSASVPASSAAQALETARATLQSLVNKQPSLAELESARRASLDGLNKASVQTEALAEAWLDAGAYNLTSDDDVRTINALTPAEVQRVAAKLFREAPVAAIAVGEATQLQAELARTGAVEVMGAGASPEPKSATTPTKRP